MTKLKFIPTPLWETGAKAHAEAKEFQKSGGSLGMLFGTILLVVSMVAILGFSACKKDGPTNTKSYPCTATVLFHGTGATHTCTLLQNTNYKPGTCVTGYRSSTFYIHSADLGMLASSNWTLLSCLPIVEETTNAP